MTMQTVMRAAASLIESPIMRYRTLKLSLFSRANALSSLGASTIRKNGSLLVLAALSVAIARSAAAQSISSAYHASGPSDSITVPFSSSAGVTTADAFSGPVEIQVSGTGEAFFTNVSDAFYYTGSQTETSPSSGDFELAVGTPAHPFVGELDGEDGMTDAIKYDIVFINGVGAVSSGTIPAFSSASTYDFVITVPNPTATQLTFGVNDGDYADNAGSYTIKVSQLAAGAATAPEPGSLVLLVLSGLPVVGTIARRSRKSL